MGRLRGLPLAAAVAALLLGCEADRPRSIDGASIRPVATFAPSATPPPPEAAAAIAAGQGLLRVETRKHDVRPGYGSGEGDSFTFSVGVGYDLYDERGAFHGHVVNYAAVTDPAPVTVPLAPGRYLVAIPDVRWPERWIDVTVEAGRLTLADATAAPHE